jgi:hypothetical protein
VGCGLGDCQHRLNGKKKDLPAPVTRIQLEEQEAATTLSDTGERPRATLHPDHSGG